MIILTIRCSTFIFRARNTIRIAQIHLQWNKHDRRALVFPPSRMHLLLMVFLVVPSWLAAVWSLSWRFSAEIIANGWKRRGFSGLPVGRVCSLPHKTPHQINYEHWNRRILTSLEPIATMKCYSITPNVCVARARAHACIVRVCWGEIRKSWIREDREDSTGPSETPMFNINNNKTSMYSPLNHTPERQRAHLYLSGIELTCTWAAGSSPVPELQGAHLYPCLSRIALLCVSFGERTSSCTGGALQPWPSWILGFIAELSLK